MFITNWFTLFASPPYTLSLSLPAFYQGPGNMIQFQTSIFFQMISPMTSVRTPSSIASGESGS